MESHSHGLAYSWSHGLMDSLGLYDTTKQVDPLFLFIFSMGRYLLFGTLASWTLMNRWTLRLMYLRLLRTLSTCGLTDSWAMDL